MNNVLKFARRGALPLLLAFVALVATALTPAIPRTATGKNQSELGKPAPDFTLSALSVGDAVTLSALKGRVVLVDFWGELVHALPELMPRIAELKTRFPEMEVVAISVDASREKALTFIRAVEPGLRPVHDSLQKVADAYGVERMPSSFVIDKEGVLRFRHDGYGAKSLASIERQVQLLLNE